MSLEVRRMEREPHLDWEGKGEGDLKEGRGARRRRRREAMMKEFNGRRRKDERQVERKMKSLVKEGAGRQHVASCETDIVIGIEKDTGKYTQTQRQ